MLLHHSFSTLALLAVLTSPAWSQLTFNPANEVALSAATPNTPIKLKLASAPKGDVSVYYEAPNFTFDKCKVTFTKANWSQEQTIQATALPVYGDFSPKVDVLFTTKSVDAADAALYDNKNSTYKLVRPKENAATCSVYSDPHFKTFDKRDFDVMASHCMTLVWSPNLIVQIRTVPYTDKITLVREVAFRYNGAVVVFKGHEECQRSVPQDVFDKAGIKIVTAGKPNLPGWTGTFTLSDGTIITGTASIPAQDKLMTINVAIQAPCYLRTQKLQGLCGNMNGNPNDDNLGPDGKAYTFGPPTVWLPDARNLAASWTCPADANLFECPGKCTNFPKAPTVPDAKACSIAKGLKADTPPGYDTVTALPEAKASSYPDKPIASPAPDPEIIKKAEALCNEVFKKDDCKDKFVPQDVYLKQCLSDAKQGQSLNFTDTIKNKYMEELGAFTRPIGQDPKHPRNREAFECRKKLGLGTQECLNNCNGADHGTCQAGGCKCTAAWTGDDCSIAVPLGVKSGAPVVENCDKDDYADFKPIVNNNCVAVSGADGAFDDNVGMEAKLNVPSIVPVCKEILAETKATAPAVFCLNVNGKDGALLRCKGDDSAEDNKYEETCNAGYLTDGTGKCHPKTSSAPKGVGACKAVAKAFADRPSLRKAPCDYFSIPIKAGEMRFYCIGKEGNYKLQCPQNLVTKCEGGCVSKFENMGKPDERACGKAACAAPKAAAKKTDNYAE